jgi:hypothetical protein
MAAQYSPSPETFFHNALKPSCPIPPPLVLLEYRNDQPKRRYSLFA